MNSFKTPLRSANADRSTHTQASRPSRLRCALRRVIMLGVLATCSHLSILAQSVIMNGNYFLTHNEAGDQINTTATQTFNPSTCLWYVNNNTIRTAGNDGNAFNGNNYIQRNSFSLGGSSSWTRATNDNTVYYSTSSWFSTTYYYLRLNNTTWQATSGNSNNSNATPSAVTITTTNGVSTNPTITGNDVLTATGTLNYSRTNAAYQVGCTNYRFSNTNHYFDENGNSITVTGNPSAATIGTYTWSLTTNDYATVNNSGQVTVTSLPATDITLTLTVSAPATGGNPAAPAGTVLTGAKEITIQGSTPSAPIISINGNTVTLSTNASGSTTIRYTLDGSNPTTSSTEYSTPIGLSTSTTSPVTIKAITVRGGNTSEIAEESVTLTLPAPTITINGENKTATITSSIQGATIRYTINGSDPTSTTGAVYNGQLTGLSYMANIKAIAVKEGWNDSPISSDVVTIPSGVNPSTGEVTLFDYEPHTWSYYSDTDLPDQLHSLNPADIKITYNGNGTGNMTAATGAEAVDRPTSFSLNAAGVQVGPNDAANKFIYYKTLERENPDGSGDLPYTTIPNPFQVRPNNGTSATVTITPTTRDIYISYTRGGTGGSTNATGTLTITYTNASGNEQTQTITINGTGNTTITAKVGTTVSYRLIKTNTANQNKRSVSFSAKYDNGNGNNFITEKTCTSTTTATTGTSGNIATPAGQQVTISAYRGFYAWRVKSLSTGLTIKDAENANTTYAANSIIPAERKILFVTSNEYNNEVVFEALWAQAYVQTGTNNLTTFVPDDVPSAYERNFHVVNESTTASSFAKNYPCTVIGHAPSSTTLNNTRTITGGFTAAADTKFEDVTISSATGSTWSANNHDLIIGRGCTGTLNYLKGIDGNVTSPTYKIRLESGTFNYVSFLRGYSTGGDNSTDTGSSIGGTPTIKGVLGCDYDRANNENGITDNIVIQNGLFYGYSVSEGTGITYSDEAITVYVKSGKIGKNFTINNSYTADASEAFYIGIAGQRVRGHRQLFIEGGQLASIAGGIDATQNQNNKSLTIRMTGGHVRGAIYGGGARSAGYGNRTFIFTGGNIVGWIGGGCNGETMPQGGNEDTYGGITYGASKVYFGGTAVCGGEGSNITINGSLGGTVFGAGKGVEGNTTSGRMSQGTTVVIADDCDIERNVYGGGNFGYAQTSSI